MIYDKKTIQEVINWIESYDASETTLDPSYFNFLLIRDLKDWLKDKLGELPNWL